MIESFQDFFARYIHAWENLSLDEMRKIISNNYQAREITSNSEIVDFGYEESMDGWEEAFQFVGNTPDSHWIINKITSLPVKENEVMVVLWATLIIEGRSLETANLFFQTFRQEELDQWRLVRSYIEAGVPLDKLQNLKV
jgi:hypothetical protein